MAVGATRWDCLGYWLVDTVQVNKMPSSLPHFLTHFNLLCHVKKKPARLLSNSDSVFPLCVGFCLEKPGSSTFCFEWMAAFLQHTGLSLLLEEKARGREGQNKFIYKFGGQVCLPMFCSLKWATIVIIESRETSINQKVK